MKKVFNSKIQLLTAVAILMLTFIPTLSNSQTLFKASSNSSIAENVMTKESQKAITPQEALQKLKDGNQRFVEGKTEQRNLNKELEITTQGQFPYAIVLSCVDSRTSSELIFDEGFGDIFSTRIAGNFVNTDILGSMEFACKVAGSKLVLVVGHSKCGAISGACDNVELGNLTHIIDHLKPAVNNIQNIKGERNSHNSEFVNAVAKENVKLTINEIREKSSILAEMEMNGEIMIVGAMLDLETGKVEFFQN
jgi:carbonic anhydrase